MKLTSKRPDYAEQKTNYRTINFDVNVNFKPSDILVKSPDNQGLKLHFGSYNAQLTGEVMLATLLRIFAGKVTILLNPVKLLVI